MPTDEERLEPLYRATDPLLAAAASELGSAFGSQPAVGDAERLDRYQVVMRQEFGTLSLNDAERALIAHVLISTPVSISLILSLDSEVIEAMRLYDDAELRRRGVYGPGLVDKLRAMSAAQKCAVVEAFERGTLTRRRAADEMTTW